MHGSAQPEKDFEGPLANSHPSMSTVDPGGQRQGKWAPVNAVSDLRSLEERELESTLQLLVERAQYITGATGTALALPQGEEMVCRASAGTSAPAIGARLQVQSGLTGESILRRQLLRCDNAETDPRVNLEACRALGIASIVVLPLIRPSGEVRGLFELFSDHPYAFEERDLIALERMAVLTQTALDLAERGAAAARAAPDSANSQKTISVESSASGLDPSIVDVAREQPNAQTTRPPASSGQPAAEESARASETSVIASATTASPPTSTSAVTSTPSLNAGMTPKQAQAPVAKDEAQLTAAQTDVASALSDGVAIKQQPPLSVPSAKLATTASFSNVVEQSDAPISLTDTVAPDAEISTAERGILMSPPPVVDRPVENEAKTGTAENNDKAVRATPVSMLRVQKCSACGFPVSEGRSLCLDCENKDLHIANAAGKIAPKVITEKTGVVNTASDQISALPAAFAGADVAAAGAESEPGVSAAGELRPNEEFIPAFLANSAPVKESWLSDHVNILAIIVFILCILVAIVIFR